jgi:hypothetical protein
LIHQKEFINVLLKRPCLILAGLILFELLIVLIYLGSILTNGQPYHPFDMNGFMTIPSLFQAFQLLSIGLISLTLFIQEKNYQRPPSQRFKLAIAILLIYGGIDEIFKIHLQLKDWFSSLGDRTWLGIYVAIFLGTPLLLYPDFRKLWRSYRRETLIAIVGMIIFAMGGFGAEIFRNSIDSLLKTLLKAEYSINFFKGLRIALEEFAELLGESLILYSTICFFNRRLYERESAGISTNSPLNNS